MARRTALKYNSNVKGRVVYPSKLPIVPQKKTHLYQIFPATLKGLSAAGPLTNQDPQTATILENCWNRQYGNELRAGYERWASNLGVAGNTVETLMNYNPPVGLAAAKLFAALDNMSIYNVTTQTGEAVVPAPVLTIPNQVNPGVFSHINFATGGGNFLCMCGAGAGYWTYSSVGGWVNRTANITGPGAVHAVNFDFIFAWKNRIWFLVKDSSQAFFLDTNAIEGPSHLFDFGPLLTHGGGLSAAASWTVDGGIGVDDYMVLVGSGGDVLVYQGTDPTDVTLFSIRGTWFIGRPPVGRRFMSPYGGDLMILCENGAEYMSHVLQAMGLVDPANAPMSIGRQYNIILGREIRATGKLTYWSMVFLPAEQAVIVSTPNHEGSASRQHVFNSISQSWSTFKGMPMACTEVFNGDLYFGTQYGTVCKSFGVATDDQLSDKTPGKSIMATVQTAFVTTDANAMALKRPLLVMPMFQAITAPSVKAQINTEWSTEGTPGFPVYRDIEEGVWNVGLWAVARWGGASNTWAAWVGATGLGCYMSLRMMFTGLPGTLFTSWKVVYEEGGIM